MKLAVFASVLACAAAFAPASKKVSTTALKESPYSGEIGVIAPTGFFDPAGLSKSASPDTFAQYRASEIKHGRVAMLAVVGYVFQEVYRFPGEVAPGVKFADVPNGVAALSAIPALGWAQIFFLIGAVDYYGVLSYDIGKPDLDAETFAKRQTQELQNGRLAMLATLELLRHDSQNLVSPGFDGYDNLITGLPFLY